MTKPNVIKTLIRATALKFPISFYIVLLFTYVNSTSHERMMQFFYSVGFADFF